MHLCLAGLSQDLWVSWFWNQGLKCKPQTEGGGEQVPGVPRSQPWNVCPADAWRRPSYPEEASRCSPKSASGRTLLSPDPAPHPCHPSPSVSALEPASKAREAEVSGRLALLSGPSLVPLRNWFPPLPPPGGSSRGQPGGGRGRAQPLEPAPGLESQPGVLTQHVVECELPELTSRNSRPASPAKPA